MERYEVPPERLERWLGRWAERHGPVERTEVAPDRVTFVGAGGRAECEPPFPPLRAAATPPTGSDSSSAPGSSPARVTFDGFEPRPLLDHVARERLVGVLLVRLGGHAAGVFEGRRLVASKVGSRLVHGRHRAGGSSQRRFERRREGQARVALAAAANVAAAVLLGRDRRALATVLEDPRLRPLAPLVVERVLDVPDPRAAVLRATPDRFLATIISLPAR